MNPSLEYLLADAPVTIVDGITIGNFIHVNGSHDYDVVYSIGYEIDDADQYCDPTSGHKYFDLGDTSNDDLTPILNDILPQIREDVLLGKKVYVHCQLGQSRSPAVVAGYLIKYHGCTDDSALQFVYSLRRNAWISPVFRGQLAEYSRLLS
jgi:dual specificity protein phosphatase-like protein